MTQDRLASYGASLDLDLLTKPERRAYVAVRLNGESPKDHGLSVGRSRRTVQNLVSKAERKLDGGKA